MQSLPPRGAAVIVALLAMAACGDDACDASIDPSCDTSPYRYVAIIDRDTDPTQGGVDLDGVALLQGTDTFYAGEVHECIEGPSAGNASADVDCDRALDAPTSELGECVPTDAVYAELGGEGGSIVMSFEGNRAIHAGDRIRVFECGTLGMNQDAYDVWIGTGTRLRDAGWVVCAELSVGVTECTVPQLP